MIRIEDLTVRLPDFCLQHIHLDVGEHEFFALMGPTGAGKTVLLEAVAGLIPVHGGRIFIGSREVTGLPPEKRGIGIVYQDHALFPHKTVLQNITYGLRFHKARKADAEKRLPQLIDLLRLSRILNRLPTHLSGGEKQRAALARALMVSPAVLLLDEPLSALDPNFREEIRDALKDLHNAAETTFLMVTHDFTDALFLAERAAIMNHGRLEQAGLTAEVFRRPSSLFAAEFVGMKNIFPATFSGASAMVGDLVIPLERPVERPGQYLAVRPEDVVVSREATPINGSSPVKGEVARVADYGFYYSITVKTGGIRIQSLMAKSMLPDTDPREWRQAYVHLRPSSLHLF